MAFARASAIRGALRAVRPSQTSVGRAQQWRQIGRRGYASHGHDAKKASSDLPWFVSIAITIFHVFKAIKSLIKSGLLELLLLLRLRAGTSFKTDQKLVMDMKVMAMNMARNTAMTMERSKRRRPLRKIRNLRTTTRAARTARILTVVMRARRPTLQPLQTMKVASLRMAPLLILHQLPRVTKRCSLILKEPTRNESIVRKDRSKASQKKWLRVQTMDQRIRYNDKLVPISLTKLIRSF